MVKVVINVVITFSISEKTGIFRVYGRLRGGRAMSKIYFTLTGTNHYFGKEFLKKGTKIRLEKEPDNEYDKEAIKVTYEDLGKIGYVANSSYTVL